MSSMIVHNKFKNVNKYNSYTNQRQVKHNHTYLGRISKDLSWDEGTNIDTLQ